MAFLSPQQSYNEIVAHIQKYGGNYRNWYVGIASSARNRLFIDHRVSEHGGVWIYNTLASDEQARSVEQALFRLGCDGGPGGGDRNTIMVYAYLKTTQTVQ